MAVHDTLTARNAELVHERFTPGLRMVPSLRTIVIGCVTRLHDQPDLLATYFGTTQDQLPAKAVNDPRRSVGVDVETLRNDPRLPGVQVSGLVYDVTTGLVTTVVRP